MSLTVEELHAIDLLSEFATLFATSICGSSVTRANDMAEMEAAVHQLQRMVMSQSAARAHPDRMRLLGSIIRKRT